MTSPNVANSVEILKQKFIQSFGLPFRDLLPESKIAETLKAEKVKYLRRLFDPFVTLWAFLSQVLDADKSCAQAVSRVIAWLAGEDVPDPSEDTSAYCQARQRLPEKLLQRLFGQVGQDLEQQTRQEHLWCGRHVKIIDGSTVSIPDTPQNQTAYPQSSNQAPGCGFPTASIGALFSLATEVAIALVTDVPNTHDVKLARRLYGFMNPGDVLLGDRAFDSYADFAFVQNHQADAVYAAHQSRKSDLATGQAHWAVRQTGSVAQAQAASQRLIPRGVRGTPSRSGAAGSLLLCKNSWFSNQTGYLSDHPARCRRIPA